MFRDLNWILVIVKVFGSDIAVKRMNPPTGQNICDGAVSMENVGAHVVYERMRVMVTMKTTMAEIIHIFRVGYIVVGETLGQLSRRLANLLNTLCDGLGLASDLRDFPGDGLDLASDLWSFLDDGSKTPTNFSPFSNLDSRSIFG